MNDRELINHVLAYTPVDRVPVGFWFHFLDDSEMGKGLEDPSILERNIKGHEGYIKGFKPDLVKIMSDGYFTFPVAGLSQELSSPADLDRVETIDASHKWIRDQVTLVKAVTAMKPETYYFYNIFSAVTTLRFMVGRDKLVEWLTTHPEATLAAINRINESLRQLALSVRVEGGADGVYFSVQNPDLTKISDWFYIKYISPGEEAILDSLHLIGGHGILHICGFEGVRNTFLPYKQYKASIYSWAVNVEKFSLNEGREFFNYPIVLGGFPNVKGSLIETGDKETIQNFTKKLINEAGSKGLIIGADCTIPRGIPYERLEWVREAASGDFE